MVNWTANAILRSLLEAQSMLYKNGVPFNKLLIIL